MLIATLLACGASPNPNIHVDKAFGDQWEAEVYRFEDVYEVQVWFKYPPDVDDAVLFISRDAPGGTSRWANDCEKDSEPWDKELVHLERWNRDNAQDRVEVPIARERISCELVHADTSYDITDAWLMPKKGE